MPDELAREGWRAAAVLHVFLRAVFSKRVRAHARENPARVPIANATVIRRNGLANNTNHEQSVRL